MILRFGVGSKEARKQGRKNGDIEALADAMRALKNNNVLNFCKSLKQNFDRHVYKHESRERWLFACEGFEGLEWCLGNDSTFQTFYYAERRSKIIISKRWK